MLLHGVTLPEGQSFVSAELTCNQKRGVVPTSDDANGCLKQKHLCAITTGLVAPLCFCKAEHRQGAAKYSFPDP